MSSSGVFSFIRCRPVFRRIRYFGFSCQLPPNPQTGPLPRTADRSRYRVAAAAGGLPPTAGSNRRREGQPLSPLWHRHDDPGRNPSPIPVARSATLGHLMRSLPISPPIHQHAAIAATHAPSAPLHRQFATLQPLRRRFQRALYRGTRAGAPPFALPEKRHWPHRPHAGSPIHSASPFKTHNRTLHCRLAQPHSLQLAARPFVRSRRVFPRKAEENFCVHRNFKTLSPFASIVSPPDTRSAGYRSGSFRAVNKYVPESSGGVNNRGLT